MLLARAIEVYFAPFWRRYNTKYTGVKNNPFPAGLTLRRIIDAITLPVGQRRIKRWTTGLGF